MKMFVATTAVLAALTLGCEPPKSDTASTPATEPPPTDTKTATETSGKAEKAVDVTIANSIAIEAGPGAGTAIDIPANTLPAGAKVGLAVVEAPASFKAVDAAAASAPVRITATDANGADVAPTAPLTISLVIAGSAMSEVDKTEANLCALLDGIGGKLFLWRHAALEIAGGKAKLKTLHFGTFQLVYCGQEEVAGFAEVAATGEPVAPTKAEPVVPTDELSGSWLGPCLQVDDDGDGALSRQFELTFSGGNVVAFDMKAFLQADCATDQIHRKRYIFDYVIGAATTTPAGTAGKLLDVTAKKTTTTIYSPAKVSDFNSSMAPLGKCDHENWVAGDEVDTTLTSDSECNGDAPGEQSQWFYTLDGGNLHSWVMCEEAACFIDDDFVKQ